MTVMRLIAVPVGSFDHECDASKDWLHCPTERPWPLYANGMDVIAHHGICEWKCAGGSNAFNDRVSDARFQLISEPWLLALRARRYVKRAAWLLRTKNATHAR